METEFARGTVGGESGQFINATVEARSITVTPIKISVGEVGDSLNFYLSMYENKWVEIPCSTFLAALAHAQQEYIKNKNQERETGGVVQ